MSVRLPYRRIAPEQFQQLVELGNAAASELDPVLVELIKTRVSQINGCAFCINIHTKELRKLGETEQRVYLLDAWRETSLYTDRERAGLAWAEAVTRLPNGDVPDEVFEQARAQFGDTDLVQLTFVIATINSWNRLAISFRPPVLPNRPAPESDA